MEEKEVPPGAKAEEVADNIPILASEGEYVIPANVVRYVGLKTIQKLVDDAKAALGDTSEQVEGGEDIDEDDLPFDPNELEFDEEDDVPEMAEGGLIDGDFFEKFGGGKFGVKKFVGPDGKIMFVPIANGKPMYDVPEGYTEQGTGPAAPKKDAPESLVINKTTGGLMDQDSTADNVKFVEENKSPLAGNPNDWGVQDFLDYGESRGSPGNMAVNTILGMMPLGGIASKVRGSYLNRESAELMDQMLDTKLDLQGNPIPEDQYTMLSKTRQDMIDQMGGQTGLNLSPFDRVADALKSVMKFTSSAGSTVGEPRGSATSGLGDGASEGYTYSGGSAGLGSSMPSSSDSQYSGTTLGGAGTASGSPSQSAQDNAQSGTGGLYAKGGYITRKKKMC